MKGIAYCRVSTEDQAQFGVSLAAQEQKIRQYCALYEIELMEVITDAGISAKNLKRPGVQKLLALVKVKAIETVVIAKLDRLTRSVRDLADIVDLFNKQGVSLVSVNEHIDTGSAAGRMCLNMLGVISQWEREAIGERTATAINWKRSNGESYSGRQPLYGYSRLDGLLIPVESEQNLIRMILSMKNQRPAAIARTLEQAGLKTRSGNCHWHHKLISKILHDSKIRSQIDEHAGSYAKAA